MSLPLSLLLLALGVLYVSVSVAILDGPFDIFSMWREYVGQSTWVGRGLHCPMCVGLYFSAIPAIIMSNSFGQFILFWLGIAGAVMLMYKLGWK